MWGIKQTILSVAGISTLGGASVGCYYCFKSEAPKSSQTINNNPPSTTEQPPKPLDTPNKGAGRSDTPAQVPAKPQSSPDTVIDNNLNGVGLQAQTSNPSTESALQGARN